MGDIGAVDNTTSISNSITLQTTTVNLSAAISGESRKSEKVEGASGDDLIAAGKGRDRLIGGGGADQFYFSGEEQFKKKLVDKILDFDSSEGDAVVIAEGIIQDLKDEPLLAFASNKKELKRFAKEEFDLLYLEPKSDLYVDSNGDAKGFGNPSVGGLIADLPNDTPLTESNVLIGQ